MTGTRGHDGMRLIITGPDGGRMDITDEVDKPIYTFGFVKPHMYARRSEIMEDIWRLSEQRSARLYVLGEKDDEITTELAKKHYWVHRDKPFFGQLVEMVTGYVHSFVLAGNDAIPSFRALIGATNPRDAEPGTLRHKYGEPERGIAYNAVHGSDSPRSMVAETELHFGREELDHVVWERIDAYKAWLDYMKL